MTYKIKIIKNERYCISDRALNTSNQAYLKNTKIILIHETVDNHLVIFHFPLYFVVFYDKQVAPNLSLNLSII
nr:hypothetical protein CH553_03975 [Haemophilus influenzae]